MNHYQKNVNCLVQHMFSGDILSLDYIQQVESNMVDNVKLMPDFRVCVNNNILIGEHTSIEECQAYIDQKFKYGEAQVLQVVMTRNNPEPDCEWEPWRVKYSTVSIRDKNLNWREADPWGM
jgi:hypothetical protein